MRTTIKIFKGGKSGVSHWRRLSAMAGALAVVGASAVLTAPSAYADYVTQNCNTYHSWTECLSYDWTTGTTSVNALNGYSTSETEALWIQNGSGVTIGNEGFNIPSHSWRGFPVYVGLYDGAAPFRECAGINNVQIICATFS